MLIQHYYSNTKTPAPGDVSVEKKEHCLIIYVAILFTSSRKIGALY